MDPRDKQRAAENLYENYMAVRRSMAKFEDMEMFAKAVLNNTEDFKLGFIEGAKEIIKIFFE